MCDVVSHFYFPVNIQCYLQHLFNSCYSLKVFAIKEFSVCLTQGKFILLCMYILQYLCDKLTKAHYLPKTADLFGTGYILL